MPEAPVVSFQDVTFSYDGQPVIEDATFSISERELICAVGPNGGGKTTLLKLALGLITPDSGAVGVFGENPKRARSRIGYMPQYSQHDAQFPITAMDVVLMGRLERHWCGPYSEKDKTIAKTALEEMGMVRLADGLYSSLSGGQKQRVLIARALATQPELLILDEPAANVDLSLEEKLYDILKELNRRMAILLVTHDLGFVSEIVERVLCVNRQVVIHPTSEITAEVIQNLYGGDFRLVRHDHTSEEESGAKGD
ncbi:MAG: metal ABC transporter ATP-binding protein [Candidatus Brocadiia bacterium]